MFFSHFILLQSARHRMRSKILGTTQLAPNRSRTKFECSHNVFGSIWTPFELILAYSWTEFQGGQHGEVQNMAYGGQKGPKTISCSCDRKTGCFVRLGQAFEFHRGLFRCFSAHKYKAVGMALSFDAFACVLGSQKPLSCLFLPFKTCFWCFGSAM